MADESLHSRSLRPTAHRVDRSHIGTAYQAYQASADHLSSTLPALIPLSKMLFVFLLLALGVNATIHHHIRKDAQPGSPVVRDVAPSESTIASTWTSTTTQGSTTITTDPPVVRVGDAATDETSTSCTPRSICRDGITCGVRYGG